MTEGTIIEFDASGSRDLDGDTLTYQWTFGDGTVATGVSPDHYYRDNCICTVSLIVSDPSGAADTASGTVEVRNAPPVVSTLPFANVPTAVGAPTVVPVTIHDPGGADTHTVTIDWGDGTTSADTMHVYTNVGPYTVTVTAVDDDGANGSRKVEGAFWVYDPTGKQSGYEAIDLGTLGGRWARPMALNDNGQVVGYSETADGRTHAFLWDNGVMRDVSGHFNLAWAQVITNSGRIGGIAVDNAIHVFVWDNGVVTELGTMGSPAGAQIVAITSTDVVAWRGASIYRTSAIWQNGVQRDLGSVGPAFHDAQAMAMNNRRQIVGTGLFAYWDWPVKRAFLWENGIMRDLGVLFHVSCPSRPELDCGTAEALDINNDGHVVGLSHDAARLRHAVRWTNGIPQDLGPGEAVAINGAGDILINGFSGNYYWRSGVATPVPTFGGQTSQLKELNDAGVVTGFSLTRDRQPHVFVWELGEAGLTDLGVGPPEAQADGALAVAINSHGDVIGYAGRFDRWVPLGPTRAILWRKINR